MSFSEPRRQPKKLDWLEDESQLHILSIALRVQLESGRSTDLSHIHQTIWDLLPHPPSYEEVLFYAKRLEESGLAKVSNKDDTNHVELTDTGYTVALNLLLRN